MHISRIAADGQVRCWAAHGDRIPGVLPLPLDHDHEAVARIGGRFARITTTGERLDDLLRPLEHPVAVVAPAGPKMVKRFYVAAPPDALPWPDPLDAEADEEFCRRADPHLPQRWRRL